MMGRKGQKTKHEFKTDGFNKARQLVRHCIHCELVKRVSMIGTGTMYYRDGKRFDTAPKCITRLPEVKHAVKERKPRRRNRQSGRIKAK